MRRTIAQKGLVVIVFKFTCEGVLIIGIPAFVGPYDCFQAF